MRTDVRLLFAIVLSASCSRTSGSPPSDDHEAKAEPQAERPGLGEVMVQVARRFEVAGRAASANRFELAAFEANELGELFENDVPRASLPKEGPTAQIPAMAKAFLDSVPPELAKAAASRDRAAFALAFQHPAGMCNACHRVGCEGIHSGAVGPRSVRAHARPAPAPFGIGPMIGSLPARAGTFRAGCRGLVAQRMRVVRDGRSTKKWLPRAWLSVPPR